MPPSEGEEPSIGASHRFRQAGHADRHADKLTLLVFHDGDEAQVDERQIELYETGGLFGVDLRKSEEGSIGFVKEPEDLFAVAAVTDVMGCDRADGEMEAVFYQPADACIAVGDMRGTCMRTCIQSAAFS